MRISHCSLYFGLRHGNFKARPEFQKRFQTAKKMAFSLVDEKRSLDVVCQTSHDIESGESALHTLARRVAILFVRLDPAAFRWMLTLHVAALIFCVTVMFTLRFTAACRAWRKLFYRSNFPLRNGAQVLAHRRRIEKKKTIKRMKAAAAGKQNVKIESSDDDYDVSDDELATPENELAAEEKAGMNGNGAGAAASSSSSTAPRFGAATSSRFAEKKEPEKPKKNARRKFEEDE